MNEEKEKDFDLDGLTAVRRSLEEKMLTRVAQALCLDGRVFEYETALGLPLTIGSYVELKTRDGKTYLGQIVTREVSVIEGPEYGIGFKGRTGVFGLRGSSSELRDRLRIRQIRGSGLLLGTIGGDGRVAAATREDTFVDAELRGAHDETVRAYLGYEDPQYITVQIGRSLYSGGHVRVSLEAKGFDRHTLLCGQTGSGKTFALGVLLEQLLYNTKLRVIVLDPNSDFVRVGQIKERQDINKPPSPELSEEEYDIIRQKHEAVRSSLRVLRPVKRAAGGEGLLRLRFSDLEIFEQARILRLDPVKDLQEFHTFSEITNLLGDDYSLMDVVTKSSSQVGVRPRAQELAMRIQNTGVLGWEIWAGSVGESMVQVLGSKPRCTVVDLGPLSPVEKQVLCTMVLGYVWEHRDEREPVLLVVDEAHNVCPQAASSDLEAAAAGYTVRIAGEGRKYRISMLLVTQQPSKIHAHVISQCENLVLMKMNDCGSLKYISEVFSQVAASLVNEAGGFGQGEALVSGRIVRSPSFAKFEGRITQEGGQDMPPTWAAKG